MQMNQSKRKIKSQFNGKRFASTRLFLFQQFFKVNFHVQA